MASRPVRLAHKIAAACADDPGVDVKLKVTKDVARFMQDPSNEERAVKAIQAEVAHFLNRARSQGIGLPEVIVGYTNLMPASRHPPCAGFWDLLQPGHGMIRCWYEGNGRWYPSAWKTEGATHLNRIHPSQGDHWRGLMAPWPGGYTYRVPGQRVVLI